MIRGHRPSYREALLYLRDHLSVKCPGGLATAVRALLPQALPGSEACMNLGAATCRFPSFAGPSRGCTVLLISLLFPIPTTWVCVGVLKIHQ